MVSSSGKNKVFLVNGLKKYETSSMVPYRVILMDDSAKPLSYFFIIWAVWNNVFVSASYWSFMGTLLITHEKNTSTRNELFYPVRVQASWCVTISLWSIQLMETFFLGLCNVRYGIPSGCPWTQFVRHCIADTHARSILASVTHMQWTRAHTQSCAYTH